MSFLKHAYDAIRESWDKKRATHYRAMQIVATTILGVVAFVAIMTIAPKLTGIAIVAVAASILLALIYYLAFTAVDDDAE